MRSKSRPALKKDSGPKQDARKYRNFPKHSIEAMLVLPQKIQDEMGGKPMNRLLLADALGLSPSSSNFRDLLSSSNKYGFTEGNEKSDEISLTSIGTDATQGTDKSKRLRALRTAALRSPVFGQFFRDYANKRVPSPEMLPKILRAQYGVPVDLADECANLVSTNGRYVELIRDIGGSPHILLDAELSQLVATTGNDEGLVPASDAVPVLEVPAEGPPASPISEPHRVTNTPGPKPIFVGHGKNKAPLQQLQKLLTTFQIPHKIVIDEANLGRPIPQKVKDIIEECGSAILIFTRDEQFFDGAGNEIWRPSENVVHELGATSLAYGDRIVIFKEKGLHFPTNFQSIGYIEFEPDDIQARTADLLRELIGFGLVRVTTT
jgi:predicted nucleotide-binding protein